jgi:hypothetical protein
MQPMVTISGLAPVERAAWGRAARAGRAVSLEHRGAWPAEFPYDELFPFCSSVRLEDPAALRAWSDRPVKPPPGPLPVTVVIPTHRRVPWGIEGWRRAGGEVLVVANHERLPAEMAGARVLRLPWRGHGPTRQAALAAVETPYVLFSVDDAVPLGVSVIRELLLALEGGPWEAVLARQVPWPDADPVTRARLRRWTPPGDAPAAAPRIDHVATLHRTDWLRQNPLPDVPIAEDAWWGRGRSLGYVPQACVAHAHPRRPLALFRRDRDIHAELVRMGEPAVLPTLADLLTRLPGSLRAGPPREVVNSAAELLGQWAGGRRARRGARR